MVFLMETDSLCAGMIKLILGLAMPAVPNRKGLKCLLILNTIKTMVFPTFLETSTSINDNIPAICHGLSECIHETKPAKKFPIKTNVTSSIIYQL
jgi:hypothetical protein